MLSILEQNDYLGVFPKKLFNQYIENSNLKIMGVIFFLIKLISQCSGMRLETMTLATNG